MYGYSKRFVFPLALLALTIGCIFLMMVYTPKKGTQKPLDQTCLVFQSNGKCGAQKPKLTVIIVIDQFGDVYVQKTYYNLKYGLKRLFDGGLYYANAYHPHGMPATGTGHAALSSGSFAKFHGIIGNKWLKNLKRIDCDADDSQDARIINPMDGSLYDYGASSHYCMVDTLSDQFMLASSEQAPHKVFSFSSKSRAAVLTAGKMGKVLWLDDKTGLFTSSCAYYDELPWWVIMFNKEHNINAHSFVTWQSLYPKNSYAYRGTTPLTYAAITAGPRVNTHVPVKKRAKEGYDHEDLYSTFQTTPQANQHLLDLGKACLDAELDPHDPSRMILWLCLSPLDKLGHIYGPDSVETIDLLYHLDKQLDDFMQWIEQRYGKDNVLWALTGDHGIGPIVEVAHKKGFDLARRFYVPDVMASINRFIAQKYGISNIIGGFLCPQLYLNHDLLAKLNSNTQIEIIRDIVKCLKQTPGIKDAWSFKQLKNGSFLDGTPEYYLQQQLFEGRSGDIIILSYPHAMVTKWKQGADHRSPYQFNLHVPLCLYWPSVLPAKKIMDRVFMLQFPKTVADLLNIEPPSACIHSSLPGII